MSSLWVNVWPDAKETALGAMEGAFTIGTLSTSNQTCGPVVKNGTSEIKRVRVYADAAIYLAIGADPDATETAQRFPVGADNPEYFTVPLGTKFAAITR